MEFCECVMALAAFLAGTAAAAFFMMVIGVHKGDRARFGAGLAERSARGPTAPFIGTG